MEQPSTHSSDTLKEYQPPILAILDLEAAYTFGHCEMPRFKSITQRHKQELDRPSNSIAFAKQNQLEKHWIG
jgi:hypothetical protein